MKKYIIGVLAVLVLVLGGIFFGPQKNGNSPESDSSALLLAPSVSEDGGVTVTVTPKGLLSADGTWDFLVSMDTHLVELDTDLVKNTVLRDDAETEYRPLAWEGDPPGGHHQEGILVFQPIRPAPVSVELKIKDVGGVPERSFMWDLQ